ncbi:MAG: lasso peptide biosynthesis B2 protein [Gemmatimonadota bacterium]|nr:lasso peptide biosynthesis B2 protein [Gemmatimonadota bacterium]
MTSRARPAFLQRLARLSARDWLDIAEAQLELLVAKIIVATRRTGELVSRAPLDPFGDAATPIAPPANLDPRPEQLALAIGRAAENGVFRPLCLVRAVALKRLLDRHDFSGSVVKIGVRMSRGRFAAHAWVAYGEQILGDQEWHVKSFAELDEISVMEHA